MTVRHRDVLNVIGVLLIGILVLLFASSGQPLTAVVVGLVGCWGLVLVQAPLIGVPMGVIGAWGAWLLASGTLL